LPIVETRHYLCHNAVWQHGYCDHFVMVWVCYVRTIKQKLGSSSSPQPSVEACWFWVQKVRGTGSSFQTFGTPLYLWNGCSYKV